MDKICNCETNLLLEGTQIHQVSLSRSLSSSVVVPFEIGNLKINFNCKYAKKLPR